MHALPVLYGKIQYRQYSDIVNGTSQVRTLIPGRIEHNSIIAYALWHSSTVLLNIPVDKHDRMHQAPLSRKPRNKTN